MREVLPTELLLRLMNATPAQYAAVAEILGVKDEVRMTKDKDAARADGGSATGNRSTVSEDVARSAFALVQKLDVDAPMKAPSVLTVFRLYCVEGNSAERVARKCRCGKATVIRRLQFIEARTGVKADQFRAMSGHLQQVDEELNTSGAREIYRRGLDGSATDHGYEED